jgi:hypothetical protein
MVISYFLNELIAEFPAGSPTCHRCKNNNRHLAEQKPSCPIRYNQYSFIVTCPTVILLKYYGLREKEGMISNLIFLISDGLGAISF